MWILLVSTFMANYSVGFSAEFTNYAACSSARDSYKQQLAALPNINHLGSSAAYTIAICVPKGDGR